MVQISGPPGVPHVNASIVPKKQDQYEVSNIDTPYELSDDFVFIHYLCSFEYLLPNPTEFQVLLLTSSFVILLFCF